MAKIRQIISLLTLIIAAFILTSCKSGISVDVSFTPQRTAIKMNVKLSDPEEKLASGTLYANIYKDTDADGKYDDEEAVSTKNLSVTTYNEQSVTFSSLSVETKYYFVINANYGKKQELYTGFSTTTNVGTADDPASIETFEDLMEIGDYEAGYYILENDIDCTDEVVTPLFDNLTQFSGSFDGNGHTISNVTLSTTSGYSGLFGYNAGTIKNLTINNITITSSRAAVTYCGVIAGYNTGVIENVDINNATITATSNGTGYQYIGGLVGYNGEGATSAGTRINDCKLTNINITLNARNVAAIGGMVGENYGETAERRPEINDSSVSGTIIANLANLSDQKDIFLEYAVGGFIGRGFGQINNSYADMDLTVTATKAAIEPSAYTLYVGGFVGELGTLAWAKINGCAYMGNISVTALDVAAVTDVLDLYIGGIVGFQGKTGIVTNAIYITNNSSITANVTTEVSEASISATVGYLTDAAKIINATLTGSYIPVITSGAFTSLTSDVCVDYSAFEAYTLQFINDNK